MRKITEESVNAFVNGKKFKKANMEIEVIWNKISMYLHGNLIATLEGDHLYITDAGWKSNTTKERLNGILDYFGLPGITQKNYVWYIGNKKWEGSYATNFKECVK